MSFDAVGIVSEKPERSIEFFNILGVDIKQYADTGHYEGVTSSGVRIMLDSLASMKEHVPGYTKKNGNGVVLCFKQTSPYDVNDVYQKLMVAGFQSVKEPFNAVWGHRYACVSDPDGNQIDLFAEL